MARLVSHLAALLIAVVGFNGVAEAGVQSSGTIRLPVGRLQIEVVGQYNSSEPIEAKNEVLLSDPDGAIFGKRGIPTSVEDAVAGMQKALPREYQLALLAHLGLTYNGQQAKIARTDLRSDDLSQFLYDRWAYAHPRSRLAKEFRCLVSFEGDISVFKLLIAEKARQELGDEESIKYVSRLAQTTYWAAAQSAGVALRACEGLVRLGWSPDKRR